MRSTADCMLLLLASFCFLHTYIECCSAANVIQELTAFTTLPELKSMLRKPVKQLATTLPMSTKVSQMRRASFVLSLMSNREDDKSAALPTQPAIQEE